MKCKERQTFQKKSYDRDYKINILEEKHKKMEQAKKERHIEFQKEKLASIEHYKARREKESRMTNRISKECLLQRIQEITWKTHTKAIEDEISSMKEEIEKLYLKFEKDIDNAALKVKDADNYNSIIEVFDVLYGGRKGQFLINKEWKKIKTKLGIRLQEIADDLNEPLKCFLCPSIESERYCERCKIKKIKNNAKIH